MEDSPFEAVDKMIVTLTLTLTVGLVSGGHLGQISCLLGPRLGRAAFGSNRIYVQCSPDFTAITSAA